MSAEATTVRTPQAAATQGAVRLVEVRIAKPWRLSRLVPASGAPAMALQGWAVAAMLLVATLPAAAQQVWFDPDIPADQVVFAEAQDDGAAPCAHELVPIAIASVHAPR